MTAASRGSNAMISEVEGSFCVWELSDGFHIRVGYRCPHCGKRHRQLVISPTDESVLVDAKCERGKVKVLRYR